jgi:8-oxo-dGTP pyrophosphatase MutT (NUDIX family)
MKTRLYADLTAFVRAACTHASHLDREVPLLPFYVREHPVGWLRPSFADILRRWPHVFEITESYVTLRVTPDTVHGRTAAMAEVTQALGSEGVIRGWRDEPVSVSHHYAAPELLRIERAATRHFGMMAYGAHLTGFTRRHGEPYLWIARRAASKSVDPDRLDNLVGGRIASGYTVDETIRKEAWEEAGIPAGLVAGTTCASVVRVEYSVPEGLHREIIFAHDLWLAEDFRPQNQDGEVARLYCLSVPEAIEAILAGEFTLDAGAVTVDALLRNGVLAPEDPQYLDLVRLLKP